MHDKDGPARMFSPTRTADALATRCNEAGWNLVDPLAAMREVVAQFGTIAPIAEQDLAPVCKLISARLPTVPSAILAAHLRHAAGLAAHPSAESYHDWVARTKCAPILNLHRRRLGNLDLATKQGPLRGPEKLHEGRQLGDMLTHHLAHRGLDWAVGGYGEQRSVYTTDDFRGMGNNGPRRRSVHLGCDYWPAAQHVGAEVYAPLPGTVVRAGQDATRGGYGYFVVLCHEPTPKLTFYTLYGHLGPLPEGIVARTRVRAGSVIGQLGAQNVNGGWPPHLHFQVMLCFPGAWNDFPGVAYPEEAGVWLGLCPDPATLFPLPPH